MNTEQKRLTDEKFWGDIWEGVALPSYPDPRRAFDRCLGEALKRALSGHSGSVLEIGCAPGTWLAFLKRELDLAPAGLEYSDVGLRATQRNLDLLKISNVSIYAADFFELQPEPRFDVVMSLGFIEHFDDPDAVIDRHLAWLKPGGLLVLGVPNFTGINGWLQSILEPSLLACHNLNIMNLDFFSKTAKRLNLQPRWLAYLGSFEPNLLESPKRAKSLSQFLAKTFIRVAIKLRPPRIFDTLNHAWFSGYILGVFGKPH